MLTKDIQKDLLLTGAFSKSGNKSSKKEINISHKKEWWMDILDNHNPDTNET